mmetsp:Transcript_89434/g.258005  ORF Transcript_89434/g.258005 Transcript_89434/m.258005 type:complete len:90 (+) Transcript_89434:519-788(+)
MNTVEVRDVDASLVWWRTVFAMLVNVERKEDNIYTINLLENQNAFTAKREFFWIILVCVSFKHSFTNFKFSIHRSYLADDYWAAFIHDF